MIIYILNIIIVLFSLLDGVTKGTRKKNELGEIYIQPKKYYLFLCCFIMIFVYAVRGSTGMDTPGYNTKYNRILNRDFIKMLKYERDWLFSAIMYIDAMIFGKKGIIFHNAVIGALAYLPIIYVYTKYSRNVLAAVFLYIITTTYYFAFNGQRQGVAIGITVLGYPFLLQKKLKPWVIICIIASFFHKTAYLMIPIGFLLVKPTTSKPFMIISIMSLISAILLWSVWNQLFELLGMMGQDKIVHDYGGMTAESVKGANPLRVIIAAVPIILGVIYYKIMDCARFQLIMNYCIWQMIFIVASTRNLFFYRCSSYFAPIQVLIFIEIGKIFNEKSRKIYWTILIALYLGYMWVSLHSEGGMLPYNLFGKYRLY